MIVLQIRTRDSSRYFALVPTDGVTECCQNCEDGTTLSDAFCSACTAHLCR